MIANSISRRRFLQASGAAAIWAPSGVMGYTASEMRSFYENGEMKRRTPFSEIRANAGTF